jgi:YesN/AraC family two-component response regulator
MHELRQYDMTVLYVEDEDFTREEVLQFLKRRVRAVFPARDGKEGLALYRDRRPDLVITDIRMPCLDGLQMARQVREQDGDALIIVTTAHSDAGYMLDAIDIGVDQYVLKPVNLEKLAAAMEKCARIVEFRRAETAHRRERERLIGELQEALSRVKQLSGFLPICASCKKIRDDRGYWQQIEAYIRDHSEAESSHAICPDCARRIYPQYYHPESGQE